MNFNSRICALRKIGLLLGVTILVGLLTLEPLLAAPKLARSPKSSASSHQTSRRPMIQNQLAETAMLLRSSQNPGNITGDETGKLMKLCKVIGQSQVLLLQVNTKWLPAKKKKRVDTNVEKAITELNFACDGAESPTNSLKKAWEITGKVQRRLTMLSKSLQPGGTI